MKRDLKENIIKMNINFSSMFDNFFDKISIEKHTNLECLVSNFIKETKCNPKDVRIIQKNLSNGNIELGVKHKNTTYDNYNNKSCNELENEILILKEMIKRFVEYHDIMIHGSIMRNENIIDKEKAYKEINGKSFEEAIRDYVTRKLKKEGKI